MKIFLIIFLFFDFVVKSTCSFGSDGEQMREIRTYMSYSWPIDPAKIITLPDMDLSYALASTLVEWGHSKQIVSGLAETWETSSSNTFRLHLRRGLKWSSGEPVISHEVKECLEHGMRAHPEDWQSLTNILLNIQTPTQQIIEFNLKTPVTQSNLLGKLTEANFGITKIKNGAINVMDTTGPFYVSKMSPDELELKANPHFNGHSDKLASRIVIKKTPRGSDPETVLLTDTWPNLTQLSSIVPSETFEKYKKSHFSFWNRPADRVFYFQMGKRIYSDEGKKLFRFFYNNTHRDNLVRGLTGYKLNDQIFPEAYQLHDQGFEKSKVTDAQLPREFKSRPLEILLSPERVGPILQKNIVDEVTRLTGNAPKIISVQMNEQLAAYKKGEYDFYVGTVGLADPDPDGLMSFYLENDYKIIPELGKPFVKRLNAARKETSDKARLSDMRAILSDAIYAGHIVPFFNLSTMAIAKAEIDLSQVPITDESVTLSKVRFKDPSR